jgi:6-phosphogluconate dehydrogenase
MIMQIGLIGLGKMGLQLALNLKDKGIQAIATDAMAPARQKAKEEGIRVVDSIEAVVQALQTPRIVWLMVPSGKIVELVIEQLKGLLDKEDILIDGGNSMYLDTLRRYEALKEKGIRFLDCGTSGGVDGARNGACLMVGGDKDAVKRAEGVFQAIAKKDGYAHVGEAGSGHYVKMVHNGIEYGMMQAIGEGFDLLKASRFDLDYRQIASVWANGSIIEGLLMRNVRDAFTKDNNLDAIEGKVDDSGEGQWMIEEALKNKVALNVIAASLFARYKSKDEDKFAEKVVAAMRNEFGGHAVYKK